MSSVLQLSNVTFLYEMFRSAFGGVEWFFIAYLICLAGFFVAGREFLSVGFLYPAVFMLLTIFNPFLIVPVAELIGLTSRIRRIFWLLPVNLVVAYGFTVLCFAPSKKIVRVLLAVCCVAFVVRFGTSVKPHLLPPQNIYKTTDTILEISDLLEKDAEETGTDKAALYSSQQLLELRQYDPSIRSLLRRTDLLDWEIDPSDEAAVKKVIKSGHRLHILALVSRYGVRIDPELFRENAKKCNANYIISHSDMELEDYFLENGYEKIGQADEYEVYRIALE